MYSGEFIIVFGPSGCGKSTLLHILAGLEPATSGQVLIRKEDIAKLKGKDLAKFRRTKIGIVFQQYNLLRTLTSAQNIALPLAAHGIALKRRHERALHILEMLNLSKLANKIPVDLSGGEQQRISLGRALVANPWILFADEPTGNLDSKSADEVFGILVALNRKSKRTVIMVTHNPNYLPCVDRVFVMTDGQIVNTMINSKEKQLKAKVKGISGLNPEALAKGLTV